MATVFMEYDANGNITVLSRYGTYGGQFGQTDLLQMSYAGNRLTGVYDVVGQPVCAGTFGFSNGTGLNRYRYDKCGALLHDGNRGIALIDYDDRGYPARIQFTDGSVTDYVYASDGRRLRMRHLTAVEGLSVALNSRHELTESETLSKDSVDYMGNFQVIGNRVRRFDFADGYATYRQNVPADMLDFHFFVRDHQGSVTAVIGDGSAEQRTRYYPFGGLMTQDCTGEGVSADKYTGKRLDRMHGLDWYDFGARQYDPVYGRFAGIDPLCEKYPHLSPYAYCGNDPVNFVDPDGKSTWVIYQGNGQYKVMGGNLYDKDRNIYSGYFNEQHVFVPQQSIGISSSMTSFYNADKNGGGWQIGSIIDVNDKSGDIFLTNIIRDNPPLFDDYIKNARNNHPYDFKVTNGSGRKYSKKKHYRGMPIGKTGNEQTIYSSARDIGNIAAGYVAAVNGMSWEASRIAFDYYQGEIESVSTRNAEYYGWKMGYNNTTNNQKADNLLRSFGSMLISIWNYIFE